MNIVDRIRPIKYSDIRIGDWLMYDQDFEYNKEVPMFFKDKPYEVCHIESCAQAHPDNPCICKECLTNGDCIYLTDEQGRASTHCGKRLKNVYGMYLRK